MEESFAKAECLLPNNRKGLQQGFTRWNSTTDYREKPVFRFDGKFVCSVVRMSAGGHHTCIIFGMTLALIPACVKVWSCNRFRRRTRPFSFSVFSLIMHTTILLGQVMKTVPIATLATWNALAGMTTIRVQCRSALMEENRR